MLLSKNFFLLLSFIVLHIALAVESVEIAVKRDTSAPKILGGEYTSYLWTARAEFDKKVTDGQLVTICEDAFESMASSIRESKVGKNKIPHVMTAMVYEAVQGKKWTVYLASSAKGSKNIVYKARSSTRDKEDCAVTNDFLPEKFKQELENCREDWSKNGDNPRHKNNASCGEQNILLMIFADLGEMPHTTEKTSSIVARYGNIEDIFTTDEEGKKVVKAEKVLQDTKTIPPCTEEGGYGCDEVLEKHFGKEGEKKIKLITEDQVQEPYTDNLPVSVEFPEIFRDKTKDSSSQKKHS